MLIFIGIKAESKDEITDNLNTQTQENIETGGLSQKAKASKDFDPPISNEITEITSFYAEIAETISEYEREIVARLVYLEARNQSFLGQKAVVEVVFNRVISSEFPNTIEDVIYQENQFSPAKWIDSTTPTQEQYDVVDEVLSEIYPVLNSGVVFFSTEQYNDYLYEQIGDHYFCYSKLNYENQKGN